MTLSPIKIEILETMLLNGKPMKAMEIASENKKEFPPTMMHLLGLVRKGYVETPQKGIYIITESGKKALDIPETTKETAKGILAYAPHDKSFMFYIELDKPLHMHAHSLQDFANKLNKVDIKSVEFHTKRGDFESWFTCLGDPELAKKTALLKTKKVEGEALRLRLHSLVEQRLQELLQMTGQALPQ
jgi:hypothetical protein